LMKKRNDKFLWVAVAAGEEARLRVAFLCLHKPGWAGNW